MAEQISQFMKLRFTQQNKEADWQAEVSMDRSIL
jgi:hypothetical protein